MKSIIIKNKILSTILLAFLLISFVTHTKADYLHDTLSVYFGKNDYLITSFAKQKLETLDKGVTSISLEGYTDPDGKAEYNKVLSNNRAMALKNALVSQGFDGKKISFIGKGALGNSKALNEFQKANLRRVDVFIIYDTPRIISKRPQVLFLKSGIDTIIQGKEGTLLELKSNSLDIASNHIVRLELTEYFSPSDILNNDLCTLSDNQPLESAGMIKIEAYDVSENAVIIKPGEKMVVRLPNKMKLTQDGFEDFYGEMNETTKQINWKVSVDTSDVLWADSEPKPKLGENTVQQLFKILVEKEDLKCNEITEVKVLVMKSGKVKHIEFVDWELDKKTKQFISDLLMKKTTWLPAEHNGIKYNMYVTINLYNKDAEAAQPVVQKVAPAKPVTNVAKVNVTMEINTTNYLGMSIDRLGWINCDRFYNYPSNAITNFIVNSSSVIRGRLIFKRELSMLPMSFSQFNEMVFINVPKGLPVYVYLEKYMGNKKFISFSETTISSTPYSPPVFVEANDEVLKMIDAKLKR